MCTIEKKYEEMRKNLKKQPIFFIGSGLSRRYLDTPDWKGLLEEISKNVGKGFEQVKNLYEGDYEKLGQELEYYCFRNAEEDEGSDHRLIFRNKIAEIIKKYCDKFNSNLGQIQSQALSENEEFNKSVNDKLKKIEEDNHSEKEYGEKYRELANEIEVFSEKYRKKVEIEELRKITPKAIITTNYDTMIEEIIYKGKTKCHVGQKLFRDIEADYDMNVQSRETKVDLYKIHGCIKQPETIVITKEDYDNFFQKSKYLYAKILTLFCEYPLIFMGYSISDRNIKDVLTTIIDILSEEEQKKFLSHIWVLGRSEKESLDTYSEKTIELLNGKKIKIQCFDIYDYSKFFKTINIATNIPEVDELKFSISDDVIELLIKPLYEQQDKFKVVTRELLQNALDACKLKNVGADIRIEMKEEQNDVFLEVRDNGIGMNIDDVKKNFLTVGKSSKKNVENGMVGKYGIGILSLYLIGEYAEVYTKKENFNLLSFKLSIKEDDKKQVEWIEKSEKEQLPEEPESSYTLVRVKINEIEKNNFLDIKEKKNKDIIEVLGLNNYITNGKNHIHIKYDDVSFEIPELQIDECFCKENDEINVYKSKWLEKEVTEKEVADKTLQKIYNQDNTVFFNDMISRVTYNWPAESMLKGEQIPFVVLNINDLTRRENEFKTMLSRNMVEISGDIAEQIQKEIYTLEIDKVIKIIDAYKADKIQNIRNVLISECGIFGKKADILIKNEKLVISTTSNISYLELWGYDNYNTELYFQVQNEQVLYKSSYMKKSSIADFLESQMVIAISISYLDDYIYKATGSNNGLRIGALRYIFDFLGMDEVKMKESSVDIWAYIISHREEIKNKYIEKSENGILWLQEKREDYRFELKNSRIIFLEKGYLSHTVDGMFADILRNKLRDHNLEEYLEII